MQVQPAGQGASCRQCEQDPARRTYTCRNCAVLCYAVLCYEQRSPHPPHAAAPAPGAHHAWAAREQLYYDADQFALCVLAHVRDEHVQLPALARQLGLQHHTT